jgi:hypothetical protein
MALLDLVLSGMLALAGVAVTHHLLSHRRPTLLRAAHVAGWAPGRALGVLVGGLLVLGGVEGVAEANAATAVTRGLLAALVVVAWVVATSWAVKLDADPAGRRTAAIGA